MILWDFIATPLPPPYPYTHTHIILAYYSQWCDSKNEHAQLKMCSKEIGIWFFRDYPDTSPVCFICLNGKSEHWRNETSHKVTRLTLQKTQRKFSKFSSSSEPSSEELSRSSVIKDFIYYFFILYWRSSKNVCGK